MAVGEVGPPGSCHVMLHRGTVSTSWHPCDIGWFPKLSAKFCRDFFSIVISNFWRCPGSWLGRWRWRSFRRERTAGASRECAAWHRQCVQWDVASHGLVHYDLHISTTSSIFLLGGYHSLLWLFDAWVLLVSACRLNYRKKRRQQSKQQPGSRSLSRQLKCCP